MKRYIAAVVFLSVITANAAEEWTKAGIVLGSQACSIIPLPRMWEKPSALNPLVWPDFGDPGFLQIRRLRNRNSVLLMGLSTNSGSGSSTAQPESPTRFFVDLSTRQPKVTDAPPGIWEMAEPLARFDEVNQGPVRSEGKAVVFKGMRFPLTGEHILVSTDISVKESPGTRFVAIASYNGIEGAPGPFNFGPRIEGTYFIDIYDVKTGTKKIALSVLFRDISPGRLQFHSYWYDNRYYVVPLAPMTQPVIFCDIEKLAMPEIRGNKQ